MSYVDLKHLLAELTLEAVRNPCEAGWAAVPSAYTELATERTPRISRGACLNHAAKIAAPSGWSVSEADLERLITRGLLADLGGDLIALPDRFGPHLAYFHRHAPRLLNALAALRSRDLARDVPENVRVGIALFNAGLYFECHEWFEGVWKATAGEAKEFYHGIVQVAAAFYHYEKDNIHGCRTLLRKSRGRLASYPPHYLGVDLSRFKRDLVPWAAHFEGAPRPEGFPRIHLLPAEIVAESPGRKRLRELRGGNG